ncbi:MAG: site-specific integrase [Desulfobacteraceae bacterium]|nr:site-specific integrase [Desulfobacteraceae bacterium]
MFEDFLDAVFEKKIPPPPTQGNRETDPGKTANRYIKEFQALFKWLIQKKYCDTNPASGLRRYKEEPFKKYVPPAESIHAVQSVATLEERDRIRCVYHSGARAGELRRMTVQDVNFHTGNLTLWTRKRKGGSLEADEIQMNNPLAELLHRRIDSMEPGCKYVFPSPTNPKKQLIKDTLDNMMPKLCKKAGVKKFGLHAIRHHVAAQMVHSKEVDLFDIQKFLRHKRMSTTDRYLKSLGVIQTKGTSVLERTEQSMEQQAACKNPKILPFKKAEGI